MIDNSCKFHLQKNEMVYTYCIKYCINLFEPINRHQKLLLISYSSSFIICKSQRKLLIPGVIFTVKTYECFMENKNIIKTFYCFDSSKTTLSPTKILLVFIKKCGGSGWTPRCKIKWQINFGENYRINTRLNLKTRFIWAKKKDTIISEMY